MKKLCSGLLATALTFTLAAPTASALELEDAKSLLSQYYYEEIPEEVLELDSLDAILEALDDPYPCYLSPEQYQSFLESIHGQELVGVGISIASAFDNGFSVLSIFPGSPAQEAGLQVGDRLVAVDGVQLTGETDPSVLVQGEAGTPVSLTVLRDGARLDFTIVRRTVTIPTTSYQLVDGAAWLDCDSLGATSADTFRQAIQALDSDTNVWVVDLRNNPGGDSASTAATAALFLGGGVMLYLRDGSGDYQYTYAGAGYPDLTDKPVILFLNYGTSSAAELFAGAIRDYEAGISIGQRTYGKGTAQIVLDETNSDLLSDGEAMKITAYRFFSPGGATNQVVGILPTLYVGWTGTEDIIQLLSHPKPVRAEGYYKLELAGQTFYFTGETSWPNGEPLVELFEALPPSAVLYRGAGTQIWTEITVDQAVQELGLTGYYPRDHFNDISGHPYEREIRTLATYFLVSGYVDGGFHPDQALTRAEFAAMLSTALGFPYEYGWPLQFSDVDSNSWYAWAIAVVDKMGFLTGYEDGTFGPDDPLTYEQLVTALSAAAAWASMDGYALAQGALNAGQELAYQDWAEWARIPARNLAQLGALPEGLTPTALVDRGTAAGMLCRLMENIGLIWD